MGLVLVFLFFLVGGLPLAGTAAMATGSASGSASASTQAAALTIVVWPRGPSGRSTRWTLRCAPAGGSLPRPAAACRRLTALRSPFAPVPKGVACTAIYGGPQVARVRGTFRGARVDAVFNRKDGCEIERWNRVRFLFPA